VGPVLARVIPVDHRSACLNPHCQPLSLIPTDNRNSDSAGHGSSKGAILARRWRLEGPVWATMVEFGGGNPLPFFWLGRNG